MNHLVYNIKIYCTDQGGGLMGVALGEQHRKPIIFIILRKH